MTKILVPFTSGTIIVFAIMKRNFAYDHNYIIKYYKVYSMACENIYGPFNTKHSFAQKSEILDSRVHCEDPLPKFLAHVFKNISLLPLAVANFVLNSYSNS